jgi:hypothetical protein
MTDHLAQPWEEPIQPQLSVLLMSQHDQSVACLPHSVPRCDDLNHDSAEAGFFGPTANSIHKAQVILVAFVIIRIEGDKSSGKILIGESETSTRLIGCQTCAPTAYCIGITWI